jgi:hydroxymethylbilane synthase
MQSNILRIATRKSPLALWQAHYIRSQLLTHWPSLIVELCPMATSGDRFLNDNLQALGGKGLFVKELEDALLEKRADIAVHSMKDVPVYFPNGLQLTTICARANPFDAFISTHHATLNALPEHATVGTSSLRRQAQLRALRPDLHIKPLRGNVGTRLKKLDQGEYDAIILAAAGLERLEQHHRIREILDETIMLPACGQGALGIECRQHDHQTHAYLKPLHDVMTARCVTTEREVNLQLGGGCHTPVAIYCQNIEQTLHLQAKVLSIDGKTRLSNTQQGSLSSASELAKQCAKALIADGAHALLTTST